MKRNLFITLILISVALFSYGQTYEIRATEGDEGYLYVQMRETSGVGTPQTTNQLTDLVFQIKWLQSLGNVDVGSVICTSYEITKSGTRSTQGSYYYQEYYADNTAFAFPENWVQNIWVTIASIEVGTGSGSGTFEIGDNSFVATGVNIGVDLTDYTPTVNGQASDFAYPTTIYNYVWTGTGGGPAPQQNQYKWEYNTNWSGTCPGDALPDGSYPYIGQPTESKVFIPGGLSNYIQTTSGNDDWGWEADVLHVGASATLTVPDLATSLTQPYLNVTGELIVDGTFNLSPKGHVTVGGSTTINSAEGIVVQADATGVGSFIDNGTITYGASGSAKVQTYLTNSAGVGNFDIHQVGPTVDEENYTGGGTGAFLSAFDLVAGSTYAYGWNETVAAINGWENLVSNTYEVRTANGIGLSTVDNTTYTMEMTGTLITGAVSSPSLTYSNNHNELISNPYPSSIDFDALAGTDNSSVVENKYWIWDPSTNGYITRTAGSGGSQYIQVGQGFFVETKSGGGTFDFTNARRAHSNDPFRDIIPNELTVFARGGLDGYQTEAVIRFQDGATSGYDVEWDGEFWESQNSDATSIRSISDDGVELAINMFPPESLYGKDLLSIPLKFECGYTSEYTLDFSGFETFDYGTEIYLEDKRTGGEWIYLNDNPVYTFDAANHQNPERFIIHFFGPTGVDELNAEAVEIYSAGQYAYVRNNTQESIKMVYVYNLAGELVMSTKDANNQMFTKFWVSDQRGYYIVKVVTDAEIYTKKVLIFK